MPSPVASAYLTIGQLGWAAVIVACAAHTALCFVAIRAIRGITK